MKKRLIAIVGICVLFLPAAVKSTAQEPHHPQISVGHQGVARLKSDFETLLGLTSETDQGQLLNLVDFVDLMAYGLDPEKPIRVDLLTGIIPLPYVISAAYENGPGGMPPPFSELIENLSSNYLLQEVGDNWREFLPPDQGWLRLLPDTQTAIMVLTTPADHALLKQILQKMQDPLPTIAPLLENDCGMGVQLINSAQAAQDQEKRAASFSELRANRMDALQKRPAESVTEFALRQGFVSMRLKELERLMVEGRDLRAQAFLNSEQQTARILFAGDGIPDTGLAQSIALFNKHEDAFASVVKAKNSVLSLRVNHPIDELRRNISYDMIDLLSKDVEARVEASAKLTDDQKTAVRELHSGIMTVVKDGIETGNVNAFVETWLDANDELIAIGGIAAVDGVRLDETLALIAKTGQGNQVESAIDKVGDTTIHRIQLGKGFLKLVDRVFGEGTPLYIATASDRVWFAIGPESVEALKEAISDLQPPAPSGVILQLEARLLPWAKHAQEVLEALPEPVSVDDKRVRRDRRRHLARAVEAFEAGDQDDVKFDMGVQDARVSGEIFVNSGLLRFVGKELAAFSRDTFE